MSEPKRLAFIRPMVCSTLILLATGMPFPPRVAAGGVGPATPYPILFVTQVPIAADFTTIGSVFGNHQTRMQAVGRGGDLWIRHTDGTLKNLTRAAGLGSTAPNGFQDQNAIAVRDPSVHWDGTRALFSMVTGAPVQRYNHETHHWQLYEITGLGRNETPVITRVPRQPANFNNITPLYGTDDRIIFTSDRPRNGASHLYPQLDEYEEAPTVSGLWSLDPATGDLRLLNHAPSGDFTPILDSFGRVIFTQWDHMQRDQQADADKYARGGYGTFNWSSEASQSIALASRSEVYPEPRAAPEAPANLNTFTFNQFFPWQINEDGTGAETLNHIGRHELSGYIPPTFTDDPNLVEFYGQYPRFNANRINNLLQIREDPSHPGRYVGIDAPEFGTHASGQVVSLWAPPSLDADHMSVTYLTHRDTADFTDTPTANHSGLYRDPLPLSNGGLIAAHTARTDQETRSGPSRYDFRLKTLTVSGNGFHAAHQALTPGISKTIAYWDPDTLVNFSGNLWELQPVEVRPRARPAAARATLAASVQQVFTRQGVDVTQFQDDLRRRGLALIISHNVTTRDDFDLQQPFNLRIPNGAQTLGAGGKIHDIRFLQLFEAEQLRGLGGYSTPRPGRRVIAQVLHEAHSLRLNPADGATPPGGVTLGADGSMAATVPALRAMTWQLTGPTGAGVVRERYWLTFQPGEIRVCTSCHGINDKDQAGNPAPQNPPLALASLLQRWQNVRNAPTALTTRSVAAHDGWVLETSETSHLGGTMNSQSATCLVGDSASNQQYRGILSFNTAALPDTAVITSATLRIGLQGTAGRNPFITHGNLVADVRGSFLGASPSLESADFQAAAGHAASAVFDATPLNGWHAAQVDNAGMAHINRVGVTQFRLRFTRDDNNNRRADYLAFHTGNAEASLRPQLVITYYVP